MVNSRPEHTQDADQDRPRTTTRTTHQENSPGSTQQMNGAEVSRRPGTIPHNSHLSRDGLDWGPMPGLVHNPATPAHLGDGLTTGNLPGFAYNPAPCPHRRWAEPLQLHCRPLSTGKKTDEKKPASFNSDQLFIIKCKCTYLILSFWFQTVKHLTV